MAALAVDLHRVELHEVRLLRALHLPVEVRRTSAVGPQLDPVLAQHVEELVAYELAPTVALDALDGEREARQDARLEEVSRRGSRLVGVEREDPHPRAVVDGRELDEALGHLHRVDLDAVAGIGAAVALRLLGPLRTPERFHARVGEDPVDRRGREPG